MATRDDEAATGETKKDEEVIKEMQDLSILQEAKSATDPKMFLSCLTETKPISTENHNDEADQILLDERDASSFDRIEKNSTSDRPDAQMPVDSSSTHYNMNHKKRGYAVIIAYKEYGFGGPPRRDCAKHDARICEIAFKKLGYDVRTYWDMPRKEFNNILETVKLADHTDCDSLVVVFMSHGGIHEYRNQEFIWTYDKEVNTSELWKNFTPEKCPSLAGKPKMFFIQACRGEEVDKGVQLKRPKGLNVNTDAIKPKTELEQDYAIPLHADMLMMWASYPGMFAFKSRNNGMNGSVFLHFLSRVLTDYARSEDLSSMLIRITREVAIHYESYVPGSDLDKNKQVPQTVSTLMRKVHFFSTSQ